MPEATFHEIINHGDPFLIIPGLKALHTLVCICAIEVYRDICTEAHCSSHLQSASSLCNTKARPAGPLGFGTSFSPDSLIHPERDYPQCFGTPVARILMAVSFKMNFSTLHDVYAISRSVKVN